MKGMGEHGELIEYIHDVNQTFSMYNPTNLSAKGRNQLRDNGRCFALKTVLVIRTQLLQVTRGQNTLLVFK